MDAYNRCLKYLLIGNLSEMEYGRCLEFILLGNDVALIGNLILE
jgi:hypothetical protein